MGIYTVLHLAVEQCHNGGVNQRFGDDVRWATLGSVYDRNSIGNGTLWHAEKSSSLQMCYSRLEKIMTIKKKKQSYAERKEKPKVVFDNSKGFY